MKRKIKVLHLVSHLGKRGGLETVVAHIVGHLNPEVFDAEIWCVSRGGLLVDELRARGLTVKVLEIHTYLNPWNVVKLAGLLHEARPDIVHTHIYYAATIGRLAAKLAGVKVLINHVHSAYPHYSPGNFCIERTLSHITQKIICVSCYVKDFVVRRENIDPSKIEVVYNGISRRKGLTKAACRRMFHAKDSHIIVTMVANLLPNKGHHVLLKALSLLAGKYGQLRCWIVGEGALDLQLKNDAKNLGLDSVVSFWGGRPDIPEILSASDIFVLPSIEREGLSIAVIEAMAYGLPIVVTDIGGLPELIDHQATGLVIPPQDAKQLGSALQELIENPPQRSLLGRQAAQKYEQLFRIDTMVAKIEEIYQKCL